MENGCNSKFPLFYWQEGKVETVFKIIWFAPCTLMHKVSFPDITEYVMMSLLWQLMKQVPEYSCFENFWVLIYNTVNIKNITHILKALVIFESLKESWDEQICETLLSRHERHAEFRLTLCNPMDCSLSGSSVHGILQARMLEWVSIPFSRRSSQPRDQTQVSCIAAKFFTVWATRESPQRILKIIKCKKWLFVVNICTDLFSHSKNIFICIIPFNL